MQILEWFTSNTQRRSLYLSTTYLESIVSPASKFHVAILIIKWKPSDVNFAGRLEDARRDVGALAGVRHHHVGRVRPVKGLVGAGVVIVREILNI